MNWSRLELDLILWLLYIHIIYYIVCICRPTLNKLIIIIIIIGITQAGQRGAKGRKRPADRSLPRSAMNYYARNYSQISHFIVQEFQSPIDFRKFNIIVRTKVN